MIKIKDLPPTTRRVAINTRPAVNDKIRAATLRDLSNYRNASTKAISAKISQLDREWDTERFLEANAASLVLIGSLLGLKTSKYWMLLTAGVGAFLLQHALQGWCPPLPLIRKRGFRTADEINKEKVAMKIMRGDFDCNYRTIGDLLTAAEK